jgi:hypothetical protein
MRRMFYNVTIVYCNIKKTLIELVKKQQGISMLKQTVTQIPIGTYRHYKGNLYRVLHIAKHSETLEPMIVYQALYDSPEFGINAVFVRPIDLFLEKVNVNGKEQARFEYLPEF